MKCSPQVDPATIVEQRDQVNSLVGKLLDQGFGELLEAMQDPEFFYKSKFSIAAFARDRGITRRRATVLLERLRAVAAQHLQTQETQESTTPLWHDSLRIEPRTTMQLAA